MAVTLIGDARGSTWHRWDPHLHAPGTLLADQFGGDWEAYFSKLEKSDPKIEALGVTDYFCIQTYKEVRRRKVQAGRLPDVKLLFPNVEMRLDIKTASQRGINIHFLFSPDDPDHERHIERILGSLTFETDRPYRCNRSDLIELGKAVDPKQTDENGALRTGANQFKVSVRDLKDLFRKERWMRENCLVAVACKTGDGTAGLQDDDSFAATRRDIESFADIIFGSSPAQRKYWLGQKPGRGVEFIESTYRVLKPCLHGSDAHREEKTGVPDDDRFCWIKGDLTFETLRQAVIEPADRVSLTSEAPVQGSPGETLDTVRTIDTPWLTTQAIRLNPGLVAIIGARGSGKTALADIIAAGAGASGSAVGGASFLKRASEPDDHIGGARVELTWRDNFTSSGPLNPWNSDDGDPELVRYLSQHFVESLCSASGLATDLRREMERVVFESVDPGDRLEASSFDELAEMHLAPLLRTRDELLAIIKTTTAAIVQEEERKEKVPAQRRDADELKNRSIATEELSLSCCLRTRRSMLRG